MKSAVKVLSDVMSERFFKRKRRVYSWQNRERRTCSSRTLPTLPTLPTGRQAWRESWGGEEVQIC